MYPKKLFSDKAGEIESSTFGKLLLVRGVESITVPKGEHYSNPLAEKAIEDLEKMLAWPFCSIQEFRTTAGT